MIRVLVADDQALVRAGFRAILEAQDDLEVVGEAADGAEAVTIGQELHPDVVLMDVRMPGIDGLEATRRLLRDGGDGPRVLMLTTFDLDEYVYEAMKAGASGFLLKDAPRDQLVGAVRTVAAGDALLAPALVRRLVEDFVRRPAPGARPPAELDDLTERELEVLTLIARGLANAEIASRLFVSEATVRTHVTHILAKPRAARPRPGGRARVRVGARPPRRALGALIAWRGQQPRSNRDRRDCITSGTNGTLPATSTPLDHRFNRDRAGR